MNMQIIANWVLKLKIKISWCCIILNNMLKSLPVMMEASTGNLNPLDYKKSVYCPRAMRLMSLIKLVKLFVLWSESYPLPVMITDTSIHTPCSPEVEHLVTTVSVTSETTNSNVDDWQSDWHSDPDSCAPEVMVPDARVFSSTKNEQKYPWLYNSVVHQAGVKFSSKSSLVHDQWAP